MKGRVWRESVEVSLVFNAKTRSFAGSNALYFGYIPINGLGWSFHSKTHLQNL